MKYVDSIILTIFCVVLVSSAEELKFDIEWLKNDAEQGVAKAQWALGALYRYGQGVPKDDAEAVKWYRKAAEQGDADGQLNLGHMYSGGYGVPEDYMWFNLAAAQNNSAAKVNKDTIVKRMTKEQIAEAQKMSREWIAKRESDE